MCVDKTAVGEGFAGACADGPARGVVGRRARRAAPEGNGQQQRKGEESNKLHVELLTIPLRLALPFASALGTHSSRTCWKSHSALNIKTSRLFRFQGR